MDDGSVKELGPEIRQPIRDAFKEYIEKNPTIVVPEKERIIPENLAHFYLVKGSRAVEVWGAWRNYYRVIIDPQGKVGFRISDYIGFAKENTPWGLFLVKQFGEHINPSVAETPQQAKTRQKDNHSILCDYDSLNLKFTKSESDVLYLGYSSSNGILNSLEFNRDKKDLSGVLARSDKLQDLYKTGRLLLKNHTGEYLLTADGQRITINRTVDNQPADTIIIPQALTYAELLTRLKIPPELTEDPFECPPSADSYWRGVGLLQAIGIKWTPPESHLPLRSG